ncbi:MAG: nucleoside permease [Chitinophagaceae bacterium]
MSIKLRLIIMGFLQFFIWGAWLITIGSFWFQYKQWDNTDFGIIFSTMGIASLFMPAITGILADRKFNAEKLYGVLHIGGALTLFTLPSVGDPKTFFWVMLLNMVFYMPTLALAITVSYTALKKKGADVVKSYPPIRVWGTIGFIVAEWAVSLLGFETSPNQFYLAGAASLFLGFYAFTLPACPPPLKAQSTGTLVSQMGLQAFTLFKQRKMAVFFLFAILLGAALQLTNAYGTTFLHDFESVPAYRDLFVVRHSAIIISISQISETLFILAIPFFLKRFGIKQVMLFSMIAWILRFGLFAYGDPGPGLWMIVLSCIVYGMAFDFFNISGSLFVENETVPKIRASAQGLFMMMTNGIGAVIGSTVSGWLIQNYFLDANGNEEWFGIWISFAGYSLVVAILFLFMFRYKHQPNAQPKTAEIILPIE